MARRGWWKGILADDRTSVGGVEGWVRFFPLIVLVLILATTEYGAMADIDGSLPVWIAAAAVLTDVRGSGWVAVTSRGTPVRLSTDAPTFVDAGAAVAWSSDLSVDLKVQKMGLKSMRSGEIAQLALRGDGFVLVQAAEGGVPEHNH